ncbi:hypothetical protein [Piscirickettsia salmonis]|uniref:hypothetical protein n=1 Tax=Piscirickettsia salmonis TaxID=1238 RepID=UPI000AA87062|nr:hypothetical protein [Piscirickettsia salmonis]
MKLIFVMTTILTSQLTKPLAIAMKAMQVDPLMDSSNLFAQWGTTQMEVQIRGNFY